VLGYTLDISQHPALALYRHGVDITISPDDPGLFGYKGTTHDFLYVFVLWDLGLADLKKLILTSLAHCRTSEAKPVWEAKWESFLAWLIGVE
jgi:adenosine deaminase CECR1